MKHLFLFLVLLFFSVGSYAQKDLSADSLLNLGNKYYNLRKYKEAAKYYTLSADKGNVEAAWKATEYYINSSSDHFNPQKARKYAKKAAEGGNVEAMLVSGIYEYNSINYKKAMEYYLKAADAGNAEAMHRIGNMYALGHGVSQDNDTAIQWWRKAGEKESVSAQAALGQCYLFGRGTAQNIEEGLKWLTMAADNDDAESAFVLANYLDSNSEGKDSLYMNNMAYYYMVAANQGHSDAQCSLGTLYWEGKGVDKNQKKAFGWFLESARLGNALGIYNTAYCYYLGKGVAQDKKKAKEYFQISSSLGNDQAKQILEKLK